MIMLSYFRIYFPSLYELVFVPDSNSIKPSPSYKTYIEPDQPALINMKCKCPRNNGGRTCGWYSGKLGGLVTQESLSAVSCNEPVIQSEFQPLTDHIDKKVIKVVIRKPNFFKLHSLKFISRILKIY